MRSIFFVGAIAGCGGLSASVGAGAGTSSSAGSTSAGTVSSSDVSGGDVSGGDDSKPDPFAYVAGVRTPLPGVYVINMMPNPKPSSPDLLYAQCPNSGPIGDDPPEVPIPDLADKTAADAVATLAKLGRVCVTVYEKTTCTAPSGDLHICEMQPVAGDTISPAGTLTLYVQSDIVDRGTDHETRRVPELDGRHRADVLADLARRGFTNVQVVDEDAGCEPDTVCYLDVPEGSFIGAGEAIVLHIRKARRAH